MANSTSEAVGDAAVAAVTNLLTSGTPPVAIPVARRKVPSVPEGDAKGLPQVVVSTGEEGPTEYLTAFKKLRKFPLAITVVTAAGLKAADDVTVRKWRDQIDAKMEARATWSGLAGFNGMDAGGGAPFDVSALSKDFNYSIQTYTVGVIEART